jgi:hypothetical protein
MAPLAPYIYSCIAFGMFMLLAAFVMDYVAIRRAAFARPQNSQPPTLIQAETNAIDPTPQIQAEAKGEGQRY